MKVMKACTENTHGELLRETAHPARNFDPRSIFLPVTASITNEIDKLLPKVLYLFFGVG
jgi:hypothetical protein